MTPEDWGASYARAVTMALSGATGDDAHPDDPFLLMLNAWWEPLDFIVPESLRGLGWRIEVDTADPAAAGRAIDPSAAVHVTGRSLVVLEGAAPRALRLLCRSTGRPEPMSRAPVSPAGRRPPPDRLGRERPERPAWRSS